METLYYVVFIGMICAIIYGTYRLVRYEFFDNQNLQKN